MKAVKVLIDSVLNGDKNYCRSGNHSAQRENGKVKFFYHYSNICTVEDGKFITDNCGWGTSSTSRAVNAYKAALAALGYKEIC